MLSPHWCRRITAWICGWNSVIGQITITLAVQYGTTLFLIGCINIFTDAEGNPIFANTTYQTYLIFLGIVIVCNLISSLGNRWLPILDVRLSIAAFTLALTSSRPLLLSSPLLV